MRSLFLLAFAIVLCTPIAADAQRRTQSFQSPAVASISPSTFALKARPTTFTITGAQFANRGYGPPLVNFWQGGVLAAQAVASTFTGTTLTVPYPTSRTQLLPQALPGLAIGTVTVQVHNQTGAANPPMIGQVTLNVAANVRLVGVDAIVPSAVNLRSPPATFTVTGVGFADRGYGAPLVNFWQRGVLAGQAKASSWTNDTLTVPFPTDATRVLRERLPGIATGTVTVHVHNQTGVSNPPRIGQVAFTVTDRPVAASRDVIAQVQRGLTERGYRIGVADGIMGSRTRGAIRDYQTKSGLPVDGQASVALRDHLASAQHGASGTGAATSSSTWAPVTGGGDRSRKKRRPTRSAISDLATVADELRQLIRKAEARRSADPWLLRRMRSLLERVDDPWRRAVFSDDFADGEFARNPAWRVVSGRFAVDGQVGLRSVLDTSPARTGSGNRSANNIFDAILGELSRHGNTGRSARQPEAAAISLPASITNAFRVELELTVVQAQRPFEFTLYQGDGSAGYRLRYSPEQRDVLELVRSTRHGETVVQRTSQALTLRGGAPHQLQWSRSRSGDMVVSVDGEEHLRVTDQGVDGEFAGFAIVNRGGDYGVGFVSVHDAGAQ